MTFDEYQEKASRTAVYPNIGDNIEYPALGLASEAGEVAGVVKKVQRDHDGDKASSREKIKKEIGGVLWYCAMLAQEFGLSLQDIAEMNVGVLSERAETGTIKGGDVDDTNFVVAAFSVPDANRRIFGPTTIAIPEEGMTISLNKGPAYGNDLEYVFGTATLKRDTQCYYVTNLRIKADSGFNADGFRDALKDGRVTSTFAGEVEAHAVNPEGDTLVVKFNPIGICIDVASKTSDRSTTHAD